MRLCKENFNSNCQTSGMKTAIAELIVLVSAASSPQLPPISAAETNKQKNIRIGRKKVKNTCALKIYHYN